MSIDMSRRKTKPGVRLLTVADLEKLPSELPSGTVVYELHKGRLLIKPPPGDIHGGVESNLVTELSIQGDRRGHGKTRCGDVGIILWRNPDTVVGADVAFIANRSLPIRTSREGYLETIPELVVEVRSKNDTGPEVETKVRDYLKAGVSVVWVADPKRLTVTAYRRGRKPKVFTAADTLTVEDIIPGFALAVAEVFRI